jgi:hypothetical protein
MQGTLHLIPADPGTPHQLTKFDRPVSLLELQATVGGFVETIPHFNSIQRNGDHVRCVAYRGTDARAEELSPNHWANLLWILSLRRIHGAEHPHQEDILCGPILIVTGDPQFMESLGFSEEVAAARLA